MERLSTIVNKLSELEVIKSHKYGTILVLDDDGDPLGVTVVDLETETSEEVMWIEDRYDQGITVEVNPDISSEDSDVQEFWTVLYCVTAVMRELDKDIWEEFDVTELAEQIYEKRKKGFIHLGEVGASREKDEEEDLEEIIQTVDIDMDTLTDLILSYDTDEEIIFLVGFMNTLAETHGWDFGLDILDDDEEDVTKGSIVPNDVGSLRDEFRDNIGLLEPMYAINNLSTLLNSEMVKDEEGNKDVMMFLNQLINERVRIEELIKRIVE